MTPKCSWAQPAFIQMFTQAYGHVHILYILLWVVSPLQMSVHVRYRWFQDIEWFQSQLVFSSEYVVQQHFSTEYLVQKHFSSEYLVQKHENRLFV